jgi:hypothetical protein
VRESFQYVAGSVLGAVLAIPVALMLGPSIAGITVVVLAGVVTGSWWRLGGQSTQVTFTALFVLLIGGYQPLHYLTPRLTDVGIGVVIGLVVKVLVLPPLQLRPAEHAVRQWGLTSPPPWTTWPARPAGLPRGHPGHGMTGSSAGRRSRPAPPRGTRGRACGGTRGPGSSGQCRGTTAPCSIPWRS